MGARGVLRTLDGGRVGFMCPGCREMHQVTIAGDRAWGFNGDYERPTLTPSVLVNSTKIVRDEAGQWTGEWERDAGGNLIPTVCHSFVTDGAISFLGDCTHDLRGQVVPLQPFSD